MKAHESYQQNRIAELTLSDTDADDNNVLNRHSTRYSFKSFIQPRINLPKRIILVRHGESLGNVDENAYTYIPDSKIPLTEKGRCEAVEVGKKIKDMIGNTDSLYIYTSPYMRTKQTLAEIIPSVQSNQIVMVREEPRLTEQQFGNFQRAEDMERYKKDRNEFGRFYYRFPDGESGLDVFGRVSSFIGTLFRDWAKESTVSNNNNTTIIIVTHGLTLRLFLMRWYRFSVSDFENSCNPKNGALIVMTRCHYDPCKEQMLSKRVIEDDEGVYQELFALNEETYADLNLPRSISTPKSSVEAAIDLNKILREAEQGYNIVKKTNDSAK